MKNIQSIYMLKFLLIGLLLMIGCDTRDVDELQPASFPQTPDVFIDDFTGDLQYAAFGGSDVTAFQVDAEVTYNGSRQSMRFSVPDEDSPEGSFAGGVFFSTSGRDLSGFNALTFYIKASQSANVGEVGFGNDLGENKYVVTIPNLPVNTNWKKVIIPIPDASKLIGERGLLYYAAGAQDGRGYTFWIDEVKFEKLSNLGAVTGLILTGEDQVKDDAETGDNLTMGGFQVSAVLPTGVSQKVNTTPYYFTFNSSNPSVAGVNDQGIISIVDAGTTTITAKLGEAAAVGSLELTSVGEAIGPETAAPTPPEREPSDVISLYSNAYTNVPVDTWNARYLFSNVDEFFVQVAGDDAIRYRDLNFVGIEFLNPTVNASGMDMLHMDIWTPDPTNLPNNFKVLLADVGPDGGFGGDNDSNFELTFTTPTLQTGEWVSLDIPLSSFTGLNAKTNLGQMVLSGSIPNLYMDNVYFYKTEAAPITPNIGAPVPTTPSEDVLSIFSDTYTNVAGTVLDPNWGQPQPGWAVAETSIQGNNTLHYINFLYQGLLVGGSGNSADVADYGFLHLDYYSVNATAVNVFLIGTNGQERSFALTVPTSGWNSVDIPLSTFNGVNLDEVKEFKFDGGSGTDDVFLDNIYFWKAPAAPTVPTVAAPVPTVASNGVLSIFSDTYTNVAGTDFYPNWGQPAPGVTVTETPIAGNNTLHYANFTYQGVVIGSAQDVSSYGLLHLDYYASNSSALDVFLISSGGVETPYALDVPTNGWNSIDIPLTAFNPVNLADVVQFKFDGGAGEDVYLDNIYFHGVPGDTGGGCPAPPAGEFIVDSGFEANADCWELIVNQGNTSVTIVEVDGDNAARIETAPAGNPGIKQTRFGVGSILPNTTYVVTFDIRQDAADPVANGAVLKAAAFSEAAEGSGIGAVRHELIGAEGSVPSAWTPRSLTFTTPANADNVAGGLSLLIELIGGGDPTTGTIFIDNVSLRAQ
jgi:hypothetical protein